VNAPSRGSAFWRGFAVLSAGLERDQGAIPINTDGRWFRAFEANGSSSRWGSKSLRISRETQEHALLPGLTCTTPADLPEIDRVEAPLDGQGENSLTQRSSRSSVGAGMVSGMERTMRHTLGSRPMRPCAHAPMRPRWRCVGFWSQPSVRSVGSVGGKGQISVRPTKRTGGTDG